MIFFFFILVIKEHKTTSNQRPEKIVNRRDMRCLYMGEEKNT